MSRQDPLPPGWNTSSIRDLCKRVVVGFVGPSKQHYGQKGVPFLTGKNIKNGKLDLSNYDVISQSFHDAQQKSQLQANDVVVIRIGRSGEAAVVPEDLGPANCGGLVICKQPEGVLPRYLAHYLNSPQGQRASKAEVRGVTRSTLNTKSIERALVPVAPRAEQERIADKLDRLVAAVDICQARVDAIPTILKRFRQSVLAVATNGELTKAWRGTHSLLNVNEFLANRARIKKTRRDVPARALEPESVGRFEIPKHWAVCSVADLLKCGVLLDVKDGNHGSSHPKASELGDEGLPFITAAQVSGFKVDYAGAKKIKGVPLSRIRVGIARKNDVVLTHKGSVGRVAVLDRDCILTPQTTYYRADPSVLLPEFLMYMMAAPIFTEQLDELKPQTTRDFVPLSQQYHLHLLLPQIEEQAAILKQIRSFFAKAQALESKTEAVSANVSQLTPSLLAEAFRGGIKFFSAALVEQSGTVDKAQGPQG